MVQAIKRDEVYIEPEGIYVETHQPERRSRKPPLLLVHGALTGREIGDEKSRILMQRERAVRAIGGSNQSHLAPSFLDWKSLLLVTRG